ncbi:O-demethylpuromycin-O-methyltransferase [Microcystis aeruginosa NIES-3806]|uniref:O-demethylpuromycin-O-methyltransferase n=3 Tax=Microcystis aeruginosa TaxID=1126 RepID=A0A6H9GJC1_MICAE|nr:methyltransferase [Microcystis aeruginosa]GCL46282.1 O-demethylpuromycin-O-methyltransferase [Microcystis aeruginosa NIES-3787]GCL53467.1 O-demethylpuromycin-O-methyltransferase [Microcystis aeruginosa NIES-3806]GCL60749.1 O-demethylpuromycin-O-methyltransferase [Microcystis aeruginosa NIES-3807]
MSLPELPLHLQLTQMVSGYWLSQAIYAAAKLSLAEHLSKGAKSCQELASLTETNPAALYRLMRALASVGIFQETESQQFILTPLAEHLSSDHPRSVKATAIMLGEAPHYQAWGNVLHSIKTGQPSFDDVFGMGVFEYFQTHPLDAEIFEQSMNSFSLSEEKAILAVYDFSEFQTLVDVGGGYGEMLGTILEQYPQLKGILFDEEYVISHCQPTLEKHGIVDRCQTVGGSFFESVPSGGDGYLLKHIIHDWDDRRAIAILKNCCQVLDSNGKVLVLEMVVPAGNNPSAAKMLDLNMLVMCPGGKERTAEEFEELLSQAGLKLNRIIPTQEDICIIECVKK